MVPHVEAQLTGSELVFTALGLHVAGRLPPVMVDNVLTPLHASLLSGRPAVRWVYNADLCRDPLNTQLGYVWFLPLTGNPFSDSPGLFPYLIQALDLGFSVQLHGASESMVRDVAGALLGFMGGGHA